jgi:hypothetical protein
MSLDAKATALRIGLIGPLPPPSGGMAYQTLQLARLLRQDGVSVDLVRTNAPYRPAAIECVPQVRDAAAFTWEQMRPRLLDVYARVTQIQRIEVTPF